ncbi:MAG: hypothetical protein R3A52_23765 [Polyangiales bacterium]
MRDWPWPIDERLAALTVACGAGVAFVIDTHRVPYGCTALPWEWRSRVLSSAELALSAERRAAMRLGRPVEFARADAEPFMLSRSFASLYALVVLWERTFDLDAARAAVGEAMPEIEALTLSTPPDGPRGAAVVSLAAWRARATG